MFVSEWEVLLVDDEPDVLAISKLAMQNFDVYGLPLKIKTAASKAEALEYLHSRPDRHAPVSFLAMAFIDVVMENDSAGLELCQAIREEMGNQNTQLFIRTGQPGVAPERTVIDRYDINGYFTKAEATEDKLYSLVKSGVRQFYWTTFTRLAVTFFIQIQAASGSRQKLMENFQQILQGVARPELFLIYMVGDTIIHQQGYDESTAREVIAKLDQEAGRSLSQDGDKYLIDDDNNLLIKVAPMSNRTAVYALIKTAFEPPSDLIDVVHKVFAALGLAWAQAE